MECVKADYLWCEAHSAEYRSYVFGTACAVCVSEEVARLAPRKIDFLKELQRNLPYGIYADISRRLDDEYDGPPSLGLRAERLIIRLAERFVCLGAKPEESVAQVIEERSWCHLFP